MASDNEMLRSLVRDALREALKGASGATEIAKALSVESKPAQLVEVVSLNNDLDLKSLVNRVLDMAADPQTLAALRDGTIAFQLSQQSSTHSANDSNAIRIEKGAVTESTIRKAAESGSTLILGRKVVVTSLARDKARDLGVAIIRENQQENQKGSVMR
ncbi:MAG: hypothetical protein RL741_398 [Actinomycetota bacterium]|jgi:hypothetical protein